MPVQSARCQHSGAAPPGRAAARLASPARWRPTATQPRELFLIDGNSLAYRAFFALPESIATSDGRPTNAIFGFASMLVKILTDYGPVPTVVVWDAGMSGRKEISRRLQGPALVAAPTCSSSSGRTCARSWRPSATATSPSRATRPTT